MKSVVRCATLLALLSGVLCPLPAMAQRRPNIVFILIDDLGWSDVGCYGSKFYETPNINRLATEGMRFSNAYAACPVCSPTRASIMTGKYPARLHLTDYIPGEGGAPDAMLRVPKWAQHLPESEVTIARALKQAGYATASMGKWHMGSKQQTPDKYGFDVNVAGGAFGHPPSYFFPYGKAPNQLPGISQDGKPGEYLTDRLTDEAEKFIDDHRDGPFFLYFAHYAVHTPLMAPKAMIEKYRGKPAVDAQKNAVYAAMIESVDDSVGRILRKIEQIGAADNTIVIFTSDNGGLWPQATSNRPLRAGKGFGYEGGIREPLIVKWPGAVARGSSCNAVVSSIDFYPTLLAMAGTPGDAAYNRNVDGLSLVPLLKQTGRIDRQAIYWHYPHYWRRGESRPFGAVRAGDWKLIEYYEDMRVELYNLRDDIGEAHNLAATDPQKAAELRDMLHDWRRKVGAQMPTPLPRSETPASAWTPGDMWD